MKFLKSWMKMIFIFVCILVGIGIIASLFFFMFGHPIAGGILFLLAVTALFGWVEKDSDEDIGW